MYADDNRVLGTYLLDLSRPEGRAYFARTVSAAIDEATPAAVQCVMNPRNCMHVHGTTMNADSLAFTCSHF